MGAEVVATRIEFASEGNYPAEGAMTIEELEDAKKVVEILRRNNYAVNLRGVN